MHVEAPCASSVAFPNLKALAGVYLTLSPLLKEERKLLISPLLREGRKSPLSPLMKKERKLLISPLLGEGRKLPLSPFPKERRNHYIQHQRQGLKVEKPT